MTLRELIKTPEALLELSPEELGGIVLEHLVRTREKFISRANFATESLLRDCTGDKVACARVLMEAWNFLETSGLIASEPASQYPNFFVTRRGHEIVETSSFAEYLKTRSFPQGSLHPTVAAKSYGLFIRGEYETAIFQAMKEVEVAVRSAANFDTRMIGTDLMRKAFNATNGPLRNEQEPEAEREALMALYSGAIGRFKNPSSHRHIAITSPEETIEILHIASHLLRVLEDRVAPPNSAA